MPLAPMGALPLHPLPELAHEDSPLAALDGRHAVRLVRDEYKAVAAIKGVRGQRAVGLQRAKLSAGEVLSRVAQHHVARQHRPFVVVMQLRQRAGWDDAVVLDAAWDDWIRGMLQDAQLSVGSSGGVQNLLADVRQFAGEGATCVEVCDVPTLIQVRLDGSSCLVGGGGLLPGVAVPI